MIKYRIHWTDGTFTTGYTAEAVELVLAGERNRVALVESRGFDGEWYPVWRPVWVPR